MPESANSVALFAGRAQPLAREGQLSAIVKRLIAAPAVLDDNGLAGDEQADCRHHGGPEKALHHYPAEHYPRLARQAAHSAGSAALFAPGSMGENLSGHGMLETDVCIGDVYALGRCRIQVSQPRTPCWKINHRFDCESLSLFVHAQRITGWYYRVLAGGLVEPEPRSC